MGIPGRVSRMGSVDVHWVLSGEQNACALISCSLDEGAGLIARVICVYPLACADVNGTRNNKNVKIGTASWRGGDLHTDSHRMAGRIDCRASGHCAPWLQSNMDALES